MYQKLVRQLFPSKVFVGQACPDDWDTPLTALEEKSILRAVPKRQAEFRAGRNAAKRVLAQMGFPGAILCSNTDRTPHWPQGIRGSISHTDHLCMVAAVASQDLISLGLDVELSSPLGGNLVKHICTAKEISQIEKEQKPLLFAKYLFSIKESFYKAYYPLVGDYLDFLQAEFSWSEQLVLDEKNQNYTCIEFKLAHLIGVEQDLPQAHVAVSNNISWKKVVSRMYVTEDYILSVSFLSEE